jgi:hypothetical protein
MTTTMVAVMTTMVAVITGGLNGRRRRVEALQKVSGGPRRDERHAVEFPVPAKKDRRVRVYQLLEQLAEDDNVRDLLRQLRDIPAQNIQSVGTFQCKLFSQ